MIWTRAKIRATRIGMIEKIEKALKKMSTCSRLDFFLPHDAQYDSLEYASETGKPHLLHLRLLIFGSTPSFDILDKLCNAETKVYCSYEYCKVSREENDNVNRANDLDYVLRSDIVE